MMVKASNLPKKQEILIDTILPYF